MPLPNRSARTPSRGATNADGFALCTAILPQFVDPAAGHVPVQMLVFAMVAMPIAVAY